jgi:hypothetical protein
MCNQKMRSEEKALINEKKKKRIVIWATLAGP